MQGKVAAQGLARLQVPSSCHHQVSAISTLHSIRVDVRAPPMNVAFDHPGAYVCKRCSVVVKASKRSKSQQSTGKGFGQKKLALEPEVEDNDVNERLAREELEAEAASTNEEYAHPEYQIYKDPEYNPQRYIGPVQIQEVAGHGRGMVTTTEVAPGSLLIVSKALARMEGGWKTSPPEPEDLHMSWLEDGLAPAQRRVLDCLYDGTEESAKKAASMTTLDSKFWSARGKNDSQAPTISSGRLLNILNNCCCQDIEQDAAAMTVRHQKPNSFVGLWPEYAFLNHSCVPNTVMTVIKDRMLIHATRLMNEGEELTRNYVAHLTTAPRPQRQAALDEAMFGFNCDCPRCRLESRVSGEVQELLQTCYSWYTQDALPRFQDANDAEDSKTLQELMQEAEMLISDLERVVDAEPDLNDEERTLLRASAYDVYDMLLMCDELLYQERAASAHLLACLELLETVAPGSESHTQVAYKFSQMVSLRYQMLKQLVKKGNATPKQLRQFKTELKQLEEENSIALDYYGGAWITRYGMIGLPLLSQLTEGFEIYQDACEQMAIMHAAGEKESVKNLEINGVKVSVVDKMDIGSEPASGAAAAVQSGSKQQQYTSSTEVRNKDGINFTLVQGTKPSDDVSAGMEDDDNQVIDIEGEEDGDVFSLGEVGDEDEGELVESQVLDLSVAMDQMRQQPLAEDGTGVATASQQAAVASSALPEDLMHEDLLSIVDEEAKRQLGLVGAGVAAAAATAGASASGSASAGERKTSRKLRLKRR